MGPSRPRRQRPWCGLPTVTGVALMVAIIGVAAVLAAGWLARHGRKPGPVRAPVAVSETGHRLLGVTAGWQIFAYGPNQVLRIQPARGRITRTAVPPLQSSGPVFFVAGPGQVIIRPLDFVPGYLVADGRPPRILFGALSNGGIAIQGPQPGKVWWQAGNGSGSMSLVWLDGRTTGVSMPLPAGVWVTTSDGRGDVLASSETGVLYDVSPGGFRRFAGTLAAVGPTRWLIVDCPATGQRSAVQAGSHQSGCEDVVINLATGGQAHPARPSAGHGGGFRCHSARWVGRGGVPGQREPVDASPGQPDIRGRSAPRRAAGAGNARPADAGLVTRQPVAVRGGGPWHACCRQYPHWAGAEPWPGTAAGQPDRRPRHPGGPGRGARPTARVTLFGVGLVPHGGRMLVRRGVLRRIRAQAR